MKKYLLFLFMTLISISTWSIDTNLSYGIKEQKTVSDYQQYVGMSFIVRPAYGELETWDKSGFKYNESYNGKIFVITKIDAKDVKLNGKPNREITVIANENGTNKKIKFKGYEEVSVKYGIWSGVKKWPLIGYMPIVFTEPFEEFKQNNLGKIITHEMVKDQYEITDIVIGKIGVGSGTMAAPVVTLKNQRSGENVTCAYSLINTKPFENALEGSYKTALMKVEKPEDSTNRYGETKVIQDEGIDKYSYNDSIIDITIYGTEKEFRFELTNISSNSLKIIWNEAAFVGLDGSTSKIMHVGTKYSQRESDQPATTIIKGAKISDLATPTANVYYDEGISIGYTTVGSGWETRPMLPTEYNGKEAGEIRLMLPIQIKEVINEYTFVFRVYYTYNHPELLHADKL